MNKFYNILTGLLALCCVLVMALVMIMLVERATINEIHLRDSMAMRVDLEDRSGKVIWASDPAASGDRIELGFRADGVAVWRKMPEGKP